MASKLKAMASNLLGGGQAPKEENKERKDGRGSRGKGSRKSSQGTKPRKEDAHREEAWKETRRDQAPTGAERPFTNAAGHDGGRGHTPPRYPRQTTSPEVPQRTTSGPRYSIGDTPYTPYSGGAWTSEQYDVRPASDKPYTPYAERARTGEQYNAGPTSSEPYTPYSERAKTGERYDVGPASGDPYTPYSERARTSEQYPSMSRTTNTKPLPSTPEDGRMQTESWIDVDVRPNGNGPPINNNVYGPNATLPVLPRGTNVSELPGLWQGTDAQETETRRPREDRPYDPSATHHTLPRLTNASDISGPWQSMRPPRTDTHRPREDGIDSGAVIDRMCQQLSTVRIEFPSAQFSEIPQSYSLIDIEIALLDLIRAYRSTHKDAGRFEEALMAKKAECESLQAKFNNDWARRSKEFEDRISTLRAQFDDDCARKNKEFEGKISKLEEENKNQVVTLNTTISVLREERAAWEERHDDKLRKAQEQHQADKIAMADDYKLRIEQLEGEMELLKNRHDGEINEFEKQHRERVASIEKASNEEIARRQSDFNNQMFQAQESYKIMKDQYDVWLANIDSQHKEEKRQMTSSFEAEKRQMAINFDTEKAQMNHDSINEKARSASTIQSQREAYETQLASLRNQNEDNRQRMAAEHQMKIDKMGRKFEGDMATMQWKMQAAKDDFHKQLGVAQDKHNQEISRMVRVIDDMEKEYEIEKKKMKGLHAGEKAALELKQEQDNKSLKEGIEALKGALVKRDHFKAMSDHELAHRFQDLASEVDSFARVRWDIRIEASWPFPDKLFRNLENERRSKQYIIQNTIWVVLYEKIFCTPFRVLGSEGRSLEQEWIANFSQDQKSLAPCPRPTKESEKWRYETMRKRLEAINQPLLEYDPNYKVKRGYELSVKEATEDISQELGRVASVSDSDKHGVSDLVRKAANLWLEVGRQRCRIFLVMSNSGARPLRSGAASIGRDGAQEQVIRPELRRIGNAQGERLERDELVVDCKGAFSSFYAG